MHYSSNYNANANGIEIIGAWTGPVAENRMVWRFCEKGPTSHSTGTAARVRLTGMVVLVSHRLGATHSAYGQKRTAVGAMAMARNGGGAKPSITGTSRDSKAQSTAQRD